MLWPFYSLQRNWGIRDSLTHSNTDVIAKKDSNNAILTDESINELKKQKCNICASNIF